MNEVCKGLGLGFCVRQQLEGFGFGFGGAPQVSITKTLNTLSIQASQRIAKLRPMQTLNLVTNINPVKATFSSGDELSICTDVLGNTKMPVLAGNNPRKCSQLRHALRHHNDSMSSLSETNVTKSKREIPREAIRHAKTFERQQYFERSTL